MSIPSIDTLDTLVAVVAKLELENRRWKRGAVAGVLGMGVLGILMLLFGAAEPDKLPGNIDAKNIRIFDDKGKCRAIFGVAENQDEALLILMDAHDKIRAGMIVSSNGRPELYLHGKDMYKRAYLGLNENDEPTLGFLDEDGNWSMLMSNSLANDLSSGDLSSGLCFMAKDQKHAACAIGLGKHGRPFIFPEDFRQNFAIPDDDEVLRQVRGRGRKKSQEPILSVTAKKMGLTTP